MTPWTAEENSGSKPTEADQDFRWQIALECAGQGVWEIDAVADRNYHSPTWFKMRGFEPDELEAAHIEIWLSRVHDDDREALLKSIDDEHSGLTDVVRHEYRERHKQGHWIWILSQGRILKRDANGQCLRTIGTDTDITELKLAQERLEKLADREKRWRVAVESAGQGLWDINHKTNVNYFSDSWRTLRGFRTDEPEPPTSEDWFETIHPEDRERLKQEFAERDNGTTDQVKHEYRQRHRNGDWVWIMSRGKIVARDGDGKVVRMIGTDTDITELKLGQERLEKLADREKRWRIAVESAGQGLWDVNNATKQNYFSESWRLMRGLAPEGPVVLEGDNWFESIHPDDKQRLRHEFAELENPGADLAHHEYRQRNANGDWMWIMSRGRVVARDASGNAVRIIGTDTDITALKKSEVEFKRLTHRYEMAVSTAKVGVWEFDLEKSRPIWDENTRELFCVTDPNEELPNDIWDQRIHPEDRSRAMATAAAAVQNHANYAMDYRIVVPSGEIRHVRCRAVYHEDKTDGPRLVGVNWDVTQDYLHAEELQRAKELAERRNLEIEAARLSLEHNALHDALTGLPNRRHLDNALNFVDQKHDKNGRVALLHVDLDRFKQINDTLGHSAGDTILRRAAAILSSNVGELGVVTRSGGDEFVVIMPSAPDDCELADLATRLLLKLSEPVVHEGHECLFGASIGIAVQDRETASGRTLLVNADIALYHAKSEGRNRFCFFTSGMQQEAIEAKKCADEIKRGLERKEFFAVYQLQFDARNHDVIGVEALARWRHPVLGVLTPDKFLQIAEEINVVSRIDELVLEQALADMRVWKQSGICIPNVSVNISARRLSDAKLIEGLRKLDIPAGSLSFELLESIYLDNHSDMVASNLEELRKLGIGIEIDDFGTGHASIACLLSLRPKRLKIDRQLVMPIVASVETRRLLASIVDIGQALGIEVLAEGVESKEHARILADLDCSCLQGFAFARPMEAADLVNFVKGSRWRLAA